MQAQALPIVKTLLLGEGVNFSISNEQISRYLFRSTASYVFGSHHLVHACPSDLAGIDEPKNHAFEKCFHLRQVLLP